MVPGGKEDNQGHISELNEMGNQSFNSGATTPAVPQRMSHLSHKTRIFREEKRKSYEGSLAMSCSKDIVKETTNMGQILEHS